MSKVILKQALYTKLFDKCWQNTRWRCSWSTVWRVFCAWKAADLDGFHLDLFEMHKKRALKISHFYKEIDRKFWKNYCKIPNDVLQYTSLMCEDARGCRRDAGNFRGVCPKIGRKSMRHFRVRRGSLFRNLSCMICWPCGWLPVFVRGTMKHAEPCNAKNSQKCKLGTKDLLRH